jgi:chemotaxis signal transduction protein
LAGLEYAVIAKRVRGVLPAHALIPAGDFDFPGTAWLAGFTTIDGVRLPVIDLAAQLGLPRAPPGRNPGILVVEAWTLGVARLAGFLAERVSEVVAARARDFHNGRLRIGRPRRILDADILFDPTP